MFKHRYIYRLTVDTVDRSSACGKLSLYEKLSLLIRCYSEFVKIVFNLIVVNGKCKLKESVL